MEVGYLNSFDHEDRERVFGFVAIFSRFESALKRTTFVKRGNYDQAEADWDAYADSVTAEVANLFEPRLVTACGDLLSRPPEKQVVEGQSVTWRSNPRRNNETDVRYLLRVVRDVRNNLFHGAK